jgi:hypothetical protein
LKKIRIDVAAGQDDADTFYIGGQLSEQDSGCRGCA